ncbi:MAG: 4Fe-4S binding protein [Deltaproteobacteria bacterium]|nr:4Fe-4S binding protein [Deltaproteobacteria bacterium]
MPELSFVRKQKLRALAKLMNQQNEMPIPVVRPLLDIMDLVMNEDETEFLLKAGTQRRTYEELFALSGMKQDEFADLFHGLLDKGLLWERSTTPPTFELAPILVGWMELQLCRGGEGEQEKEFVRRFSNLIDALKLGAKFPFRNIQNLVYRHITQPYQSIAPVAGAAPAKGVIRVNRNVDHSGFNVYPADDACELVERAGRNDNVALMHCFCRQWRKMSDESCRFGVPAESCLVVGELAYHAVKAKFGRSISTKDALKILEETRDAGVVHTVFHERDDPKLPPAAICNCCWDCCGVYGSYNRGFLPMHFNAYHIARVKDESACVGCGDCEWHCPTTAVKVKGGKVRILEKRCIGCGQCVHQCSHAALELKPLPRPVFLPILKPSEARLG